MKWFIGDIHNMKRCYFQSKLVYVPDGTFEMGSDMAEINYTENEWSNKLINEEYQPVFRSWLLKEYPAHSIKVGAFFMMMYPVTNLQFREYLSLSNETQIPESITKGLPDNHPVWGVSLKGTERYIQWLSKRSDNSWRLPTEAEWEWAARGKTDCRYPFGEEFDSAQCNTLESNNNTSTPVDKFKDSLSPFGLCDLAGNVEEWTSTSYSAYPGGEIIKDDLWKILGAGYPVLRGGSFELRGDLARTRRRHGPHPGHEFRVTGFRLVYTA